MSRYQEAVGMAMDHAKRVGESPENWTGYLNTAARMYQYPFMDALLIHAQRPDATICAELPVWNDRMNRWVNRGSKGIMLVDRRGASPGVRYVFDMKDTHTVRGGRTPVPWKIGDGQEERLLSHLKSVYHLTSKETKELPEALFAIAGEMAARVIDDTYGKIAERYPGYEKPDIQSDEEDRLFNLMESSMAYMLFVRCGLNPKEYMDADEFDHVTEFANPFLIASIGTEVQKAVREVLKDIGQTVVRIQREDQRKVVEYRFTKEELENGNDIRTERGLSVSREQTGAERGQGDGSSERERDAADESGSAKSGRGNGNAAEQVREDAGELSQGESGQFVSDTSGQRGAGRTSGGNREHGAVADERTGGIISDEGTGTAEVGDDGMDSTHEQRDSESGGDRDKRDRLSSEIAAELSLPVMATADVQRRKIEERAAALYAGNDIIPSGVVDVVLREGSNKDNSTLRIIYDYMLDQPEETHTSFVKKEYGVGGKGLLIDGHEYSVWFDGNGMEIASGRSVHDNLLTKAFLSWDEVSGRIHQLLRQGEYLPQEVMDRAWENEARECATKLCYLVDEMSRRETAGQFFSEYELFEGGYPDKVGRLTERVQNARFIQKTVSELEILNARLEEEPDILRFRWYHPKNLISDFTRLGMENEGYRTRDDFTYEKPPVFVTQDEIDAFLARNTVYRGQNRTEVYAYFSSHLNSGERAKYMKGRYGSMGGSSTALPGYDHFGYSHDVFTEK